jgi:NADP-dependent 3-hydroxy acid dehydrogenase YdfG
MNSYATGRPLIADDVAGTVAWAVARPPHVSVDLLVLRPRPRRAAQGVQHKVYGETASPGR